MGFSVAHSLAQDAGCQEPAHTLLSCYLYNESVS